MKIATSLAPYKVSGGGEEGKIKNRRGGDMDPYFLELHISIYIKQVDVLCCILYSH